MDAKDDAIMISHNRTTVKSASAEFLTAHFHLVVNAWMSTSSKVVQSE